MNDFLIDNTGDLLIKDGDLVIGRSDEQQQNILLITDKGTFKENPQVGVGLQQYLEAESSDDLLSEIRKQFVADGITIDGLSTNGGNFDFNGHY